MEVKTFRSFWGRCCHRRRLWTPTRLFCLCVFFPLTNEVFLVACVFLLVVVLFLFFFVRIWGDAIELQQLVCLCIQRHLFQGIQCPKRKVVEELSVVLWSVFPFEVTGSLCAFFPGSPPTSSAPGIIVRSTNMLCGFLCSLLLEV